MKCIIQATVHRVTFFLLVTLGEVDHRIIVTPSLSQQLLATHHVADTLR